MPSRSLVLLAATLGFACASESSIPPALPEEAQRLRDCSQEVWPEVGQIYLDATQDTEYPHWARIRGLAELTPEQRERVLHGASVWSHANCYLPCSYEMCGVLLEGGTSDVAVHVIPLEPGIIPPEAWVAIDPESGAAAEGFVSHTGCAARRGECVHDFKRHDAD